MPRIDLLCNILHSSTQAPLFQAREKICRAWLECPHRFCSDLGDHELGVFGGPPASRSMI